MKLPLLKANRIAIVYKSNGVGLDQDAHLVRNELFKQGASEVDLLHNKTWLILTKVLFSRKYDLVVCIERAHLLGAFLGRFAVVIPNQERFPKRQKYRLLLINEVWCKTKHSQEIFSQITDKPCRLIGFKSENVKRENIEPDRRKFFHLAGKSEQKGTNIIVELWQENPNWPMLTLVQYANKSIPNNVNLISGYLERERLIQLQNEHGIHLCLSSSEGWGHYIHEANSVGAIVVLTDAPPMNEYHITNRVLVNYDQVSNKHLGFEYRVDKNALKQVIEDLIEQYQ